MNPQKDRLLITTIIFFLITVTVSLTDLYYPCQDPNCEVCTHPKICSVCTEGYFINIYNSTGIPKCQKSQCKITNCSYSYSPNQCEKCQIGYQVNINGECQKQVQPKIQCQQGCLSCNETTSCYRCAYGYNLHPNRTCVKNYAGELFQECQVFSFYHICQICKIDYYVFHQVTPSGRNDCQNGTSGKCTASNCRKCRQGNLCIQCQQGYFLNDTVQNPFCSSLQCKIPNCQTCRNENSCQKCKKNYQLLQNGLNCTIQFPACSLANCKHCYQKDRCAECQKGYLRYFNPVGQFSYCIKQSTANQSYVKNCKIMDSEIYYVLDSYTGPIDSLLCRECNDGFFMLNGQCVLKVNQDKYQCNVQNCKTCIFHSYCGLCNEGYKITPNSGGLCYKDYSNKLQPNCLYYQIHRYQEGSCVVCESGYKNLYGKCNPQNQTKSCYIQNCQYCLTQNSCYLCDSGYKKSPSPQTTCIKSCSIPNCQNCLGQTKCWICVKCYNLNNDRTVCQQIKNLTNCTTIDKNCQICNSDRQCLKCKAGFNYCSSKRSCTDFPANNMEGCAVFYWQSLMNSICGSSPVCDVCEPGYFQLQGHCLKMPCTTIENCQFCYLSKTCLVCKKGYVLDNVTNKCVDNSRYRNCSTTQNPFCTKCEGDRCLECNTGYTLKDNQCFCSMENCKQCIGANFSNICLNCTKFYSLNSFGKCERIQCENYCTYCLQSNTCTFCGNNYYLNGTGACVPTPSQPEPQNRNCSDIEHCIYCFQSFGNLLCLYCTSGYKPSLTNLHCVQQNLTIKNCMIVMQDVCEQCNQGYYLNSIDECIPINPQLPPVCNIYNCMYCGYNDYCTFCVAGFLPINGTCRRIAPRYDPNCLLCQQVDTYSCQKCKPGSEKREIYDQCVRSQEIQISPKKTEQQDGSKIILLFVTVVLFVSLISVVLITKIRSQKKHEKEQLVNTQVSKSLVGDSLILEHEK